jgi:hypothetical protein
MDHLAIAKEMLDHTMKRMTEADADSSQIALSLMIIQTEAAIATAEALQRIANALVTKDGDFDVSIAETLHDIHNLMARMTVY